VYNPSNAAQNSAYYSTGAMADGQTVKPWASLSTNMRSVFATAVDSDGWEAAPVF
jgi:hypothetical protein